VLPALSTVLSSIARAAGGPNGSPAPITRDGARQAAKDELAKRGYHTDDPSAIQRAADWLIDKLTHLLDAAARHSPGNGMGLLVIVVVAAAVVAFVAVRVGRVRRTAKLGQPLLDTRVESSADHRHRAETFAAQREWAQAVREWLRAVARELEERGVLDPRPGRTAAELCAETARELPGLSAELRRAASTFDAIWYGGRTAKPDDEQLLRALDRRVAGSHRGLARTAAHELGDTPGAHHLTGVQQ
jgi:hypothetical protein